MSTGEQKVVGEIVFVKSQYKEGKSWYEVDPDVSIQLPVVTYPPGVPLADATWGAGVTVNMANYESCRIDCSIRLPCLVPEIPAAVAQAQGLVEELIAKQIDAIQAHKASRSKNG